MKIDIEVNNTEQDYRRILYWFHFKKGLLVILLYLFVTFPILWITFFGAGANPFQVNKSVILVMLVFALIPPFILGIIWLSIWKQAKNIGKTLESTKFVFSEEGIASTSKSTSVKVTWNTFYKVEELKGDFLFYPQKNIFYTVPKRFFRDDLQIEDFKKLLREKLDKKAKLYD